jgi:hypothetical protein
MNREVFEWVKAMRQEKDLMQALLTGNLDKSRRYIGFIEKIVQQSLASARTHSLQRIKKRLRVVPRTNRLPKRTVKSEDAGDLQQLLWEWYPAFRAVDERLDHVRPAWYVFRSTFVESEV